MRKWLGEEISKQPIILDTDPGIDDALALLYLLGSRKLDLKAITAVAGNVALERTFANARGLAALLGIEGEVPVYAGCHKPLTSSLKTGEEVHGKDGMGGVSLPAAQVPERDEHAANVIVELSRAWPGELKIVAVGPLTNVAASLILDPGVAEHAELVFMGGAACVPGNVPPGAAEFNAWVDPEALKLVVESGIAFTMVGLDATREATINPSHVDLLDISTQANMFASQILQSYLFASARLTGRTECALHDPLAVAVAERPQWVTVERGNVYVETRGEYTRGATAFFSDSWRARESTADLDTNSARGMVATDLRKNDFVQHFLHTLNQI